MQLKKENNTLSVSGNIVSISDFDTIKENLESLKLHYTNIVLKISDSLVINSSLIGYLVKIVNQDGIHVSLYAGNEVLFELLEDLGLAQTFNLQRL